MSAKVTKTKRKPTGAAALGPGSWAAEGTVVEEMPDTECLQISIGGSCITLADFRIEMGFAGEAEFAMPEGLTDGDLMVMAAALQALSSKLSQRLAERQLAAIAH